MGFAVASPGCGLWVLSDNDLIRSSLLSGTLKALRSSSPNILIECGGKTSGLQTLSFFNIGEFIERPLYALGLISRCVVKMFYLSASGDIPFLHHDSSFSRLAIAFDAFRCQKTWNLYVMQDSAFVNNDQSQLNYKVGILCPVRDGCS